MRYLINSSCILLETKTFLEDIRIIAHNNLVNFHRKIKFPILYTGRNKIKMFFLIFFNFPNFVLLSEVSAGGRVQTHVRRFSDNEGAPRETPSVVPTIRMLSGLPDVVLTHVHRPPGEGGACSTACDTGSAGSERREGGRDRRDRKREKESER